MQTLDLNFQLGTTGTSFLNYPDNFPWNLINILDTVGTELVQFCASANCSIKCIEKKQKRVYFRSVDFGLIKATVEEFFIAKLSTKRIEVPNELHGHIKKKLVSREQAIFCQYYDNFVKVTSTNIICQYYFRSITMFATQNKASVWYPLDSYLRQLKFICSFPLNLPSKF